MKTLFIAPGPFTWASSRIRAHWPAAYMDADVVENGANVDLAPYGAVVFVKVIGPELADQLRESGRKVFWDVCDPVWWFSPMEAARMADRVDGVVASNPGLAEDFAAWCEDPDLVRTIPDRLELDHYPMRRKHEPLSTGPVRFIWYGAGQNRIALFGGLANLERLRANGVDLSLTILDDQPDNPWFFTDAFPVRYERWDLATENETIAGHDVAFLPPYPGPWGAVKSNNKKQTAYACGLPATDAQDYADLWQLATEPEHRAYIAELGYKLLVSDYDVRTSAAEWEELLDAPA